MSCPSRAEGLRLLDRLEIPDCDCATLKTCPCRESCAAWAPDTCPACLALLGMPDPAGPRCAWHCRCCAGDCDHAPMLYQDPCHHVAGHDWEVRGGLDFERWVELIYLVNPELFEEPPPAPAAALVLRREARVTVYAQRIGPDPERPRYRLAHPGDLWRHQADDDGVRVGIVAERVENGYLDPDQRLAIAGRIGPAEAPALAQELLAEMDEGQRARYERGQRLLALRSEILLNEISNQRRAA